MQKLTGGLPELEVFADAVRSLLDVAAEEIGPAISQSTVFLEPKTYPKGRPIMTVVVFGDSHVVLSYCNRGIFLSELGLPQEYLEQFEAQWEATLDTVPADLLGKKRVPVRLLVLELVAGAVSINNDFRGFYLSKEIRAVRARNLKPHSMTIGLD